MKREGFETWPKLTGGKGVHLMAPAAQKWLESHDPTGTVCQYPVVE